MSGPITVVGLGYVGLPLAAAFSRITKTYGYDISEQRVSELARGYDRNHEVEGFEKLTVGTKLQESSIFIVTVPTPLNAQRLPDLEPLRQASLEIGKVLRKGNLVVFESTVYPGVIEHICIPILERTSNLRSPDDFFVGYSPERMNPGDPTKRVENIAKVVSGQTPAVAGMVKELYSKIVEAPIHVAPSIQVAEMAKAIENAQRDVNIAFVNEVAVICDKAGIDSKAVFEAAATKWNWVPFKPGLVGGHCIPVDPEYLAYFAKQLDIAPRMMTAARMTNDGMVDYIASKVSQSLWSRRIMADHSRVLICGMAFKENCRDTRNSPSLQLAEKLSGFGCNVVLCDPVSGSDPNFEDKIEGTFDAVIVAVAHDFFKAWRPSKFRSFTASDHQPHVFDVKHIYNRDRFEAAGINIWQL